MYEWGKIYTILALTTLLHFVFFSYFFVYFTVTTALRHSVTERPKNIVSLLFIDVQQSSEGSPSFFCVAFSFFLLSCVYTWNSYKAKRMRWKNTSFLHNSHIRFISGCTSSCLIFSFLDSFHDLRTCRSRGINIFFSTRYTYHYIWHFFFSLRFDEIRETSGDQFQTICRVFVQRASNFSIFSPKKLYF